MTGSHRLAFEVRDVAQLLDSAAAVLLVLEMVVLVVEFGLGHMKLAASLLVDFVV